MGWTLMEISEKALLRTGFLTSALLVMYLVREVSRNGMSSGVRRWFSRKPSSNNSMFHKRSIRKSTIFVHLQELEEWFKKFEIGLGWTKGCLGLVQREVLEEARTGWWMGVGGVRWSRSMHYFFGLG